MSDTSSLRHLMRSVSLALFAVILSGVPSTAISQDGTKEFVNSIGMSFRLIPSGKFVMGVPENEFGRIGSDALPQHQVTITRAFYMATHEVTQRHYNEVMGTNPSQNLSDSSSPRLPVENVTWHDAQAFCRKLSSLSKERGKRRVYRLPTEAEWEFACRAGTQTAYNFGSDRGKLGSYAWYDGNSDKKTHPVASKLPNGFGLFDMHGNVSEWCQDWKGDYPEVAVVDPKGPESGEFRIIRGLSFNHSSIHCRSGNRSEHVPSVALWTTGFRVVLEIDIQNSSR